MHLRFDLSRVSAHEEHLQQRAMIFDRHLDDLATSAFGHECPVPLPLPSVLVHASKTAETARENMADLLYLSMQAIELSPQITNDQLELALRELEASTEINAKSAQSGRSADSKDLRDA
ncbi:MAG: hypothetical protein IPK83_21240 [Planctomycetes bacterium]|nr:hypothetical protein [Planctomycetota bacterium]